MGTIRVVLTHSAARRPRILVVTKNFPPMIGGIERYISEIIKQLAKEYDIGLCGPKGCEAFAEGAILVRGNSVSPLPLFLFSTLFSALKIAVTFKPDLVLSGSGLTAPIAQIVGKIVGIPVATFVYGLDLVVNSSLYQLAWIPTIRGCDAIIPISSYTRGLAIDKGISPKRISAIVHPGVDIPKLDVSSGLAFRDKHGLKSRPVLVCIGRLVPRKGLVEFVEHCLPTIVEQIPDATLVVVGGERDHSLREGQEGIGARAVAAANRAGLEGNFVLLGEIVDAELRGVLNAADVHVFPVIELPGDSEGFGIVSIEAASFGIPTAAFAVGGIPDAIDPSRSGSLISAGDYRAMANCICQMLENPRSASGPSKSAIEFAENFSWEKIGKRARDVVRGVLTRSHIS